MSFKQTLFMILSLLASFKLHAKLPVEVIGSCIENKAISPTVTMMELENPRFIKNKNTTASCSKHFENSINDLTYGGILCNVDGYIILNSHRIKLSEAVNFSVNPTIKPGIKNSTMDLWFIWSKIDFEHKSYICITSTLFHSGHGAAVAQYYIEENAYHSSSTLYYYFFEHDIMPISSYSD